MSESRDARSIIEAAEQAAAAGHYVSAEELLRTAALLQEERLGPLDPDLANTLNNLGVVCEILDKPVDAEECFRRALAIATAALEPDHPCVITSRNNLRDFCKARGKRVDLPVREPRLLAETPDSQSSARTRAIRRLAIAALGPGAMLIVILATAREGLVSTERVESPSAIAMASPRENPAPPQAPEAVEPIATPREVPAAQHAPLPIDPIASLAETTKPAGTAPTTETAGSGVDMSADRVVATSRPERPTLVKARLCADLDGWRCDPADRPVPQGPLFFYTQVKSTRPTTVQHRWYRDNRLHHAVELRIQANPRVGYRTYSRSTMNSGSAGRWRVEVRTKDGTLLHEERFSVR